MPRQFSRDPHPALARSLILCLALAASLFLPACATSRFQSAWRDPDDNAGPPRKLAVFVVAKDENVVRMAENQAVQRLTVPLVMQAEPGYMLDLEPRLEKEVVRSRLISRGFDAALVSRVVSVEDKEIVVPPEPAYFGDPFYPGWYPRYRPWPYRSFGYPSMWYETPGYVTHVRRVVVETQFFRLPSGKPVWTGVTESEESHSVARTVNDVTELIIKELVKQNLLPPE
ncbi:MAG: DUF4136 domain-containing protein [Zoogloea sp.]|nr:DUF4136 domain-containing protein [Zoogloea sp.]